MNKFIQAITLSLMLLCAGGAAYADETRTQEDEVRSVIGHIFDAMRAGDGAALTAIMLPDAPLDRIAPDKPIRRGKVSDWIEWVETLEPGQADEQVFDVDIKIEGPLATAWAPFTIAIDGVLKSCGVNHFIFVKTGQGWKVAYLIDTHTPDKCQAE